MSLVEDSYKGQQEYWSKGYEADNVESQVFRVYGRIFKELGFDGSKGEKLLDFGCGEGGNLRFYNSKGFNVHGVDISEVDIDKCKAKMPSIADQFKVVDPDPLKTKDYFGGNFDVIVSIQTVHYFTDTILEKLLMSFYNQMNKGAIIYTTMMSDKCLWHYNNSVYKGDGLYRVDFKNDRIQVDNYYENFTESKEDLKQKFHMFKPLHTGFYSFQYRDDELDEHFYTFVGKKE